MEETQLWDRQISHVEGDVPKHLRNQFVAVFVVVVCFFLLVCWCSTTRWGRARST